MRGVLLLFDHDQVRAQALADLLEDKGHGVTVINEPGRFVPLIEEVEFDLVFLAGRSDDILEYLNTLKNIQPMAEAIVTTDDPSVEGAVSAVKQGAFHYLSYPSSLEKMELLVQKALEKRMLTIEVDELRSLLKAGRGPTIIGESPVMLELKKTIRRIATLDCTILLRGETGTGKELVARSIHYMSHRGDKKFLAVNCGALSEELLTNELFGHEKGAFTGASQAKKGLFEAASGGTILLDEIGDTPSTMQIQLLRVLQEKTVIRVGGTEEFPVDTRVIAATNRSLRQEVGKGLFREDLYYRLNIFTLRIPPLRERKDDIPLFCRYFLDKFSQMYSKQVERVGDEVMQVFMEYDFPGNVRELEHVLERAVVLCDGREIGREELPRRMLSTRPAPMDAGELPTLAQLEANYIREILERTRGNKTEAAKILGINRSSLWRKLKR